MPVDHHEDHPGKARQPFWPTRTQARHLIAGLLLVATLLLASLLPPLLVAGLLRSRWLPTGDDWPIVVLRSALLVAGLAAGWAYLQACLFLIRRAFQHRLPPGFLDSWDSPNRPPIGIRNALLESKGLLAIAALTLLVALGVIDVRSPWLQVQGAPRRYRALFAAIVWCRGNPNSVRSLALIIALASTAVVAHQVRAAHRRARSHCPNDPDQAGKTDDSP